MYGDKFWTAMLEPSNCQAIIAIATFKNFFFVHHVGMLLRFI